MCSAGVMGYQALNIPLVCQAVKKNDQVIIVVIFKDVCYSEVVVKHELLNRVCETTPVYQKNACAARYS